MPNPRLASRYAKSLLDIAIEQNSLDATLKDVQLLEKTSANRDFVNVLRSPVIKGDKKLSIFKAIFGNNLSTVTMAFVSLLINKGRESNLPEIATAFIQQYKDLKHIKTVKLITAGPVSDVVKNAILKKVVGSMPDNQIELVEEIQPELIGGFILQMEDKLFDASIRRDLNDVKAQFLRNMYVSQLS